MVEVIQVHVAFEGISRFEGEGRCVEPGADCREPEARPRMLGARDATRLHPPKTCSPPQSPIALEQLNPRVRRIWGLVICGAFREELRAEAPDSRMQVTNFAEHDHDKVRLVA